MNKNAFTALRNKEFELRRYGQGCPHAVCFGGLSYAPSDYDLLAQELDGEVFVVNNPIHTGTVTRTKEWSNWLRNRYAEICNELKCPVLIAHSLGAVDAAAMESSLEHIRGAVLLTPPNPQRNRLPQKQRVADFGLLDLCLAELCEEINENTYRLMLEEHKKEYAFSEHNFKDIYKREIPKNQPEESAIEHMAGNTKNQLLVILGSRDPWRRQLQPTEKMEVLELDAGHYLHISQPKLVAEKIRVWEKKHSLFENG